MKASYLKKARHLRSLMKEFLDKRKLNWKGMAAVGMVFDDCLYISNNQACHAGLSSAWNAFNDRDLNLGENKRSGAVAVVSAIMRKEPNEWLSKEVKRDYLDWLLNRSPYSEAFVSKSASYCLKEEFIICRTDVPSNLMAAGLVASRRIWEYTQITRTWHALVKEGVNEDLAFIIAHCVDTNSNPRDDSPTSWTYNHNGHCSMSAAHMDFKAAKAFLDHRVVRPNKNYCDDWNYNGYTGMYLENDGYVRDSLYDYISNNAPTGAKEVKVNTNPFAKALPAQAKKKTGPFLEVIHLTAEWAKKDLMEKIQNA